MKKIFIFLAVATLALVACSKDKKPADDPTKVVYGGVTYNTVTLENGQTWIAEPLRYIPQGAVVGNYANNPDIAYSYFFSDCEFEAGKVKKANPEFIQSGHYLEELGLLYSLKTIFGQEITAENNKSFEGVQGICPNGYHIPTRAEWIALVGYSTKNETDASDVTDASAYFYNKDYKGGNIKEMLDGGWKYALSGYVLSGKIGSIPISCVLTGAGKTTVEDFEGYNSAFNYIACSTGYTPKTGYQMFGLMSTFNATYPEGRANLGYISVATATANNKPYVQVRCIKDSKK